MRGNYSAYANSLHRLFGLRGKRVGKTFVYDNYEVKYDDTISEDGKTLYEATLVGLKKAWALNKFTFSEDGKVTGTAIGNYTQEGSKLTVKAGETVLREFTVSAKTQRKGFRTRRHNGNGYL